MRSDLKDNTNTINKMIQFGTVKYGIVKQLKDQSRSDRDVTSDNEENGTSTPSSPIVECSKSTSPSHIQQMTTTATKTLISNINNSNSSDHHSNEDHNHNKNIASALDGLIINQNQNNNNNKNKNSNIHQLLYQTNSPIQPTDLDVEKNLVIGVTESATILPTLYPEIEKINNHKTPSPALAEHNFIADQPLSPLVDRLTRSIATLTPIHESATTEISDVIKFDNNTDDDDHNSSTENNEDKTEAEKINDLGKNDQSNKSDMVDCHGDTENNDDYKISENNLSSAQQSSQLEPSSLLSTKAIDSIPQQLEINNSSCNSPPPKIPQFPAGPVTLEAIQNMQMAIAQFAAKTFANGGGEANEAAMKQLAFLQQTLFNLQQQQLFQIQLIQQLQSQLALNQMKSNADDGSEDENYEHNENVEDSREDETCGNDNQKLDDLNKSAKLINELTNSKKRRKSNDKINDDMKSIDDSDINEDDVIGDIDDDDDDDDDNDKDCMIEFKKFRPEEPLEFGEIRPPYPHSEYRSSQALLSYPKQDENMPLPYSSDLASSIITNHDNNPSSNCLEMLQKSTQEVLDSASQGILSGNLADEFAFGKDRNSDGKNRNEPFFKHRCRYCGKVFGSDSALQIHIRSHTGERPFKCNVCGSRFTTKGNLKVHFQRHAQKFPHVPMNSTPIPEHLDKFHPPLLEQMSPESSPPHHSQIPPITNPAVSLPLSFPSGTAFPGLQSLYRPPLDILKTLGPYSNPFFDALPPMLPPPLQQQHKHQENQKQKKKEQEEDQQLPKKEEQEMPTDLRKQSAPNSPTKPKDEEKDKKEVETTLALQIKEEKCDDEVDEIVELPAKRPRSCSISPPTSLPPPQNVLPTHPAPQKNSHHHQQQSPIQPLMAMPHHHTELPIASGHLYSQFCRDEMVEHHHRMAMNFRISPECRSPNRSPASIANSIPRSPFLNPMKHEMALLPRPHSNDNSWENFIEVSNTSETLKLKELMKNKKLTDPNQCVVCDRVLSCKSALQMHYRTHTGERPFKCRICGRAFTTKGNLKTHMAVHKIRPPMRNFHQCPVCHKKYSNALVLQQHIRLHTGEPTDLTPEQISAAEIRDFPPSMMPGSFLNPFTFNFGMGGGGHHNGHIDSESSLGELDDNMDCSDDFDDDISDHDMPNDGRGGSDYTTSLPERSKSREDMKGIHFEQKLKIESALNSENSNRRSKSEASITSAPTSPAGAIIPSKSSPIPSDSSQGALDLTPRAPIPKPITPQLQQEHEYQHQQIQQQLQHHHREQQQYLQQQLQHQQQQQQLPSPQNHALNHMMTQRPPFGMFPNIPLFPPPVSSSTHNMCTAMNTIAQSVMPSAPFNPLALSGVRGSTTCGICFKTFPCHSALEIHYRSHTKERPFKCSICDRGFTTKGNLKQHMLTHKIRDMEQDAFRNRAIKFEYMRNVKNDFE